MDDQRLVDPKLREMLAVRVGPYIKLLCDPRERRVAIISFANNGLVRAIRQSFMDTLGSYHQISPTYSPLSGDCDVEILEEMVANLLESQPYEGLFTIGKYATIVTKLVADSKRIDTPIIFGGVLDPIGAGLVCNEKFSGNQLTGVLAVAQDYASQVSLMLNVKPNTRSVAIVYNPETLAAAQEDPKKVQSLFQEKNIEATILEVRSIDELHRELPMAFKFSDTAFLMRDNFVVENILTILDYSEKHDVCVYTSDYETVRQGAAFGYCKSDAELGIEMAKKGAFVLVERIKPKYVEVSAVSWKNSVAINQEVLKKNHYGIDTSKVLWEPCVTSLV